MKIPISFADIAHRDHTAKVIPLGISMIAAYAHKFFSDKLDMEIFKSVDEFTQSLDNKIPKITCFSNYIWNENLAYQIVSRVKKKDPSTISIFGGPNYSLHEKDWQKNFLSSKPNIDFYIVGEGEVPFVELLKTLFKYDFNVEQIKKDQIKIPGCHYIYEGEFITAPLPQPIPILDEIPSPYLLGLLDKHLESGYLKPLMETTRGCPFSCTFCQEGDSYYNKVRRFSYDRIKSEILYLAKKSKSKLFSLTDSNFGMYKQDIEICKVIAESMKEHNWPQGFEGVTGKNEKGKVMDALSIIGKTSYNAAVQSTDPNVLKEVKRINISGDAMIRIVNEAKQKTQSASFSEIILGLPGDSKKAHFKSNVDMIDSNVDVARSHQFIMLPASPASTKSERERHGFITKYRVVPKTVEYYQLFGEKFFAPELDEICVGSKTLPYEDYLECRLFNLTVEMFYNNGIFTDLFKLIRGNNLKVSTFILEIHEKVKQTKDLSFLYEDFLKETKEVYNTREEIEKDLQNEKVLQKYIAEETGVNEQLVFTSVGVLEKMEELHKIAFSVAKNMLAQKMKLNGEANSFFDQFQSFILMQKKDMISNQDTVKKEKFYYDFIELINSDFKDHPSKHYKPEGIKFEFSHTKKQKEMFHDYYNTYGDNKNGLAYILATASALTNKKFYRKASYSN